MSLLTPNEVNKIAFITQIDSALIPDEIIQVAEIKYIIPAITKPVYNDLFVHPGVYETLMAEYIKPYLAYCVKYLLYSQYFSESLLSSNLDKPKDDIVNETNIIIRAKRELLVNQLSSGNYLLYSPPQKKLTAGFLVKRP